MWTDQQIWTVALSCALAALGIPAALKSGLGAVAEALDGVRHELHEFNEARRVKEVIARHTSKDSP
jgi:hypothetical protein